MCQNYTGLAVSRKLKLFFNTRSIFNIAVVFWKMAKDFGEEIETWFFEMLQN
eukprot:TRINITY_DN7642_c0_g1_i1.p1 TRINITY_DN7642_c0_g1~~TRINITY_DN7642_c0_g1_i1.p1  ORF type:complete len:52 (-),score=4.69 TRINITY_DN7642_c0_g1_i1:347-502(-)